MKEVDFSLTEEQKKLAADNFYLIHWYMKRKPAPRGSDKDDYFSELIKYYMRSIQSYDSKKSKISTYVVRMLAWGRISFCRCHKKSLRFVSIHSASETGDQIQVPVFENKDAGMELIRKRDLANSLIKKLDPVREGIIRMYMSGLTIREISKKIGVPKEKVKQFYERSIHQMRAHAGKNNLNIESMAPSND